VSISPLKNGLEKLLISLLVQQPCTKGISEIGPSLKCGLEHFAVACDDWVEFCPVLWPQSSLDLGMKKCMEI